MRKRKQGNRDMLEKHRREFERNREDIEKLTARNGELSQLITEEENVEYISLIRSTNIGLEEFERMFGRIYEELRNSGASFHMTEDDSGSVSKSSEPAANEQKDYFTENNYGSNYFTEEATSYDAE